MSEHTVKLDDREEAVLQKLMTEREMSDGMTLRHMFRMGQMMDTLIREAEGSPVGYLDDQGDFHDPFYTGPKMAPMPVPEIDGSRLLANGHIDCPCWKTGRYQRVEGCKDHPYDL